MTVPEIVTWAIVLGVGVPAALRNATAAALVIAWAVAQAFWLLTGDNLPLDLYLVADIGVIAVICGKATVREGCRAYPTISEQLRCMWRALTACDRLIIGLYLFAAWPVYTSGLHPYYQWWALLCITIAQFLLAGIEAAAGWRRARSQQTEPPPNNVLLFAPARSRQTPHFVGAEPIPFTSSDTMYQARGSGGDG